jgi:hypothetical protein
LSEVKMELYTDVFRALKFGKVEDEPHSQIWFDRFLAISNGWKSDEPRRSCCTLDRAMIQWCKIRQSCFFHCETQYTASVQPIICLRTLPIKSPSIDGLKSDVTQKEIISLASQSQKPATQCRHPRFPNTNWSRRKTKSTV